MTFRDELPPGCPPADAEPINEDLEVFRLVKSDPPTDDDFLSQRQENPEQRFSCEECVARGLSVNLNRNRLDSLTKLQRFRGRMVCRVRLLDGAGQIKDTFSDPGHRTWWPFADYDILAHASVEP